MHYKIYLKNLHLLLSSTVVTTVGLLYGFQPQFLFDVNVNTIDEANIFKAIMVLYLGFSSLWIIGMLKSAFWKVATVSNMIFMLGLAFGRIVSMILDGMPSTIFILGTIGELVLGFFALQQLKKASS